VWNITVFLKKKFMFLFYVTLHNSSKTLRNYSHLTRANTYVNVRQHLKREYSKFANFAQKNIDDCEEES